MALTEPRPRRLNTAWIVPLALLVVTLATVGGVILLSRVVSNEHLRPAAPAFTYAGPPQPYVRYSVKEAAPDKLSVVADVPDGAPVPAPLALVPGPATKVEALQPVSPSTIAVGDWVSVIGIANEVRNFSIDAIVVMAAEGQPGSDHVLRSPGGFAGNEASPNAADRVIFGGAVTAISGSTLTLNGAAGPITVDLLANAPLFRLESVPLSAIHDGDRVSVIGGNAAAPAAILAQHIPSP
ncbi:MAG TPA: hypothetical protein VN697_09845 [Tepidiformaceae bacterium]|nr:hypothetical protein [Tepidiformaceae bacterium]